MSMADMPVFEKSVLFHHDRSPRRKQKAAAGIARDVAIADLDGRRPGHVLDDVVVGRSSLGPAFASVSRISLSLFASAAATLLAA